MRPRILLPALALGALSSALTAQTVYLTEDFSTGVMPPAGWVEGNNGNNVGWEIEYAGLGVLLGSDHAWHDDHTGYNDNYIMSPAMDLTGATAVWAYCDQGITFASWRDHHYVDVSLDNGVTFINLLDDLSGDGWSTLSVDLAAYAGTNGVNVSYRYTGDYASEWELDNVTVDDVGPPPPPPVWPNMPTSFVAAAAYTDGFETYGGVTPSHFALNALDAATGLADAEAYCEIDGGSGYGAATGTACLEMGLDPLSNNYHDVRNGLIIGLDGGNASSLVLDFMAIDHGEESDTWDGVWVSDDGLTWHMAYGDWTSLLSSWQSVPGVVLDSLGANTAGQFYLLFAQDDNFPYGYLDGIGIDDILLTTNGTVGPTLSISNLVAGSVCTIQVQNASPNGLIRIGYSLLGAGPVTTPYGDLLLTPPITTLPNMSADASGNASLSAPVPGFGAGASVWLHAFDVQALTFTNPLAEVIL